MSSPASSVPGALSPSPTFFIPDVAPAPSHPHIRYAAVGVDVTCLPPGSFRINPNMMSSMNMPTTNLRTTRLISYGSSVESDLRAIENARARALSSPSLRSPRSPNGLLTHGLQRCASSATERMPSAVTIREEGSVASPVSLASSPTPFDPKGYYSKLGKNKALEDPRVGLKSTAPDKAYEYLQGRISSAVPLSSADYLKLQALLWDEKEDAVGFRKDPVVTFSVTRKVTPPHGFKFDRAALVPELYLFEVDFLLGRAAYFSSGKTETGNYFDVYRLEHNAVSIQEKVDCVLKEFDENIAAATTKKEKIHAIVLFFSRLEQIQPVQDCRRVNVAILNYLLAKYDLPCAHFGRQFEFWNGELVSVIDMVSLDRLTTQVTNAMKKWCTQAGVDFNIDA